MKRWGKPVILSSLWLDPCHLPGWARHIHPSALFGPCCLWGLDPFDPSGLSGLFGPFCLHLQYQRRRFFFALCCLGKIPGGAPFSQLHKSGNGSRVDRP